MQRTKKLRQLIDKKQAVRDNLIERIEKLGEGIKDKNDTLSNATKAQLILQTVAQQTQQQLEYRISELVSLALSSVFENPYELKLEYELKRNKTEAQLMFQRDGKLVDPLGSTGYGAVDIAGFGLRCALMSLSQKNLAKVLILDEPFKNINDKTRNLHRRAAEMVSEISKKLGLQVIVVSQIPEFEDVADSIFEVQLKKEVSHVKRI